jgi:hypothetical protein
MVSPEPDAHVATTGSFGLEKFATLGGVVKQSCSEADRWSAGAG